MLENRWGPLALGPAGPGDQGEAQARGSCLPWTRQVQTGWHSAELGLAGQRLPSSPPDLSLRQLAGGQRLLICLPDPPSSVSPGRSSNLERVLFLVQNRRLALPVPPAHSPPPQRPQMAGTPWTDVGPSPPSLAHDSQVLLSRQILCTHDPSQPREKNQQPAHGLLAEQKPDQVLFPSTAAGSRERRTPTTPRIWLQQGQVPRTGTHAGPGAGPRPRSAVTTAGRAVVAHPMQHSRFRYEVCIK